MEAEGKLAALSYDGDDDWMRKIASLKADDLRRPGLMPIGFYSDLDKVGAQKQTWKVVATPQVPFRPEILTVDPACADLGVFSDMHVGNRSVMVDSTPLPFRLFSPASWASLEVMRGVVGRMEWGGVVSPAVSITLIIDVSRQDYEPLVEVAREAMGYAPRPAAFRAALWGRAVDESRDPIVIPSAPIHSGAIDFVRGIDQTLKHADLVNKIRGAGDRRR